jgi:hypothetical protein
MSQSSVAASGGISAECLKTDARVVVGTGIALQRQVTGGCILGASCVALECFKTVGRVAVTGGIER